MNNQQQSIQKKIARKLTETVTVFRTKTSSIYLSLLTAVGVSAPLWHVIYGVSLKEGVFGFRYMSSFLNALGGRLSILCAGLLIVFLANKLPVDYKNSVKRIGTLFVSVGCFFLILIFFPKKMLLNTFGIRDAHPIFYYGLMIIFSISAAKIFQTLQKRDN